MSTASWPVRSVALPRMERLRGYAATTPGRLRVAMVLVVAALVLFGLIAARATDVRRNAAVAVASRDEQLMIQAEGLYASLSDADATAAATFLAAGIESPVRRQRYLADLRRASLQLTALAARAHDSPGAASAVAAVAASLPVYSGLMETARANNRQGFPVGAAYLRQASDLMRQRILPAAGGLYGAEARRLGDDQASGTASGGLIVTIVAFVLALAALVRAQVFVARRTRRVLNLPLVAATAVVIALGAWVVIGMVRASDALVTAQRLGSDSVQVLSAARILALRAQADESLGLVARGGGDQYVADFRVVAGKLEPPRGLLADAARLEARDGSTAGVDALIASWRRYRDAHESVARQQAGGSFGEAIRLAVGSNAREPRLADSLNREFSTRIAAAQERFDRSAEGATSALRGLPVAITLLTLLGAVLAFVGLQLRIQEYR